MTPPGPHAMTAQAGAVAACPFCGCAPEGPRQLTDIVWSMDCANVLHHVNAMSWTSAEDCIDNWNRRYLPTPPAAVSVGALEGLVADMCASLKSVENMLPDKYILGYEEALDHLIKRLIKERSNGQ